MLEIALLIWIFNVFIFFVFSLIGGFSAAFMLLFYVWFLSLVAVSYVTMSDIVRKWQTQKPAQSVRAALGSFIKIGKFSAYALAFPVVALGSAIVVQARNKRSTV